MEPQELCIPLFLWDYNKANQFWIVCSYLGVGSQAELGNTCQELSKIHKNRKFIDAKNEYFLRFVFRCSGGDVRKAKKALKDGVARIIHFKTVCPFGNQQFKDFSQFLEKLDYDATGRVYSAPGYVEYQNFESLFHDDRFFSHLSSVSQTDGNYQYSSEERKEFVMKMPTKSNEYSCEKCTKTGRKYRGEPSWEWYADNGWEAYKGATNKQIEIAFQFNRDENVDLTNGWFQTHHNYRVDFTKMTQTNVNTGCYRSVRRMTIEDAVWKWESDDGWKAYDKSTIRQIETAFQSKKYTDVNLTWDWFFEHKNYSVNFPRMVQINTETGCYRSIRRQTSFRRLLPDVKYGLPLSEKFCYRHILQHYPRLAADFTRYSAFGVPSHQGLPTVRNYDTIELLSYHVGRVMKPPHAGYCHPMCEFWLMRILVLFVPDDVEAIAT